MEQDRWTQIEPLIRETIEQLNQSKKASLSTKLIGGSLVSVVLMMILIKPFGPFMIIISLAIGFGSFFAYYHYKHNKIYKAQVVPKLVEAICPGATYDAHGSLDKEVIKAGGLYNVGWGERYNNEDTIRGKIDKTDFVYSEVKLSHTQSNGKSSHEVIDFIGFVFEADFNKYFKGKTIVTTHRFSLTGDAVGLFSKLSRIHLEDVNFENRYKSYATDDQEARYILSPALQQRIMLMHDTFRSQLGDDELSISFHDSRMLIMVPSRHDRFEVEYTLEGVKKDFLALTVFIDIVNQLNLNLRIWTKE